MGVDCYGRNEGTYFRNSWWSWRPLAHYCFFVAQDVCEGSHHVASWMSNDGEMTAAEAHTLGTILQMEINAGRTRSYAKERMLSIDAMPDEQCDLCEGTGERVVTLQMALATAERIGAKICCNKCGGGGTVRPTVGMYPFTVENVQRFADFCLASGGFEVR